MFTKNQKTTLSHHEGHKIYVIDLLEMKHFLPRSTEIYILYPDFG